MFSSAHKLRRRVVAVADEPAHDGLPRAPVRRSRLSWSALLERVFGSQVTDCPSCGDRLRVLAFLTDPDITARILVHLGIAIEPVAIAPARAPPAAFDDFA